MKTFLLALAFFSSSFLNAQHWSHVGTTWYYNFSSDSNPANGYVKLEHVSDTVVQNHACDKMLRTLYGGSNPIVEDFFLYTNSDKVYLTSSPTSPFSLLYDFSLHAADTLPCYFGWYPTTIDSTGIMIVHGDTLRILYPHDNFDGAIVERLGGLERFFPFYLSMGFDPGVGLRCYNDPVDHWSYWTGIAPYCDYMAGDDPGSDVQILPNPSDGDVNIVSSEINASSVLRLYDSRGRLLAEAKGTNEHNAVLHFHGATSAAYHVQIINGDKQTGKTFVNLSY